MKTDLRISAIANVIRVNVFPCKCWQCNGNKNRNLVISLDNDDSSIEITITQEQLSKIVADAGIYLK